MRRWVGRKFDPERFELDDNNKAIARAIRHPANRFEVCKRRHGALLC